MRFTGNYCLKELGLLKGKKLKSVFASTDHVEEGVSGNKIAYNMSAPADTELQVYYVERVIKVTEPGGKSRYWYIGVATAIVFQKAKK